MTYKKPPSPALKTETPHSAPRIGVVGGGMAGSTVALRLAEHGVDVTLFEESSGLVNGPPICHLHAGGNLYRDISDEQCITLLRQSIDTLRVFPHTANIRPTVIALPLHDSGTASGLLPRLEKLQQEYASLIEENPKNNVLGPAEEYYKLYDRPALEALAEKTQPDTLTCLDHWMIPVAKRLNLDEFKLPLIIVQEYGLSIFRIAATVTLALEKIDNCTVKTRTSVTHIEKKKGHKGWEIFYNTAKSSTSLPSEPEQSLEVDYLVNACGYRTGTLDDMPGFKRDRMVEFKAAYIAHWPDCEGEWPEVIFHGERGTPNGMAQLTPYPNGYFQLHGMTEEITLFKNGIVTSSEKSAQPQLNNLFLRKLTDRWYHNEIERRTINAINHAARFIPDFSSANVGGAPMFGAQQIPGDDPSLRAADISFAGMHYARAEIVKASSALTVAEAVISELQETALVTEKAPPESLEQCFPVTDSLCLDEITALAEQLATHRDYPVELALPVGNTKKK